MKQSIKKIFQNLYTYLFFIFFISLTSIGLSFEEGLSYDKVDNLHTQKEIVSSLIHLDKKDIELSLIQLNAKSTQLYQEIDKLSLLYKYAFIEKLVTSNEKEYKDDLQQLTLLAKSFNNAAQKYYDTKNKKQKEAKKALLDTLKSINEHIDNMLIKTLSYNEKKFHVMHNVLIVLFVIIFLATIYYYRALKAIYNDIDFLQRVNKNRKNYNIYSQEADAISLRMNRKSSSHDNPDMIDPITNINNYKGMVFSYDLKKNTKDTNFTSVTVLEVDNFSKAQKSYPEDFIQAVLKKIAYTISLNEQAIDVIARTDYNQFTIIFSRSSKEQAFKDIELIRQSIAELKFNLPNHGPVLITVSGGFVIKPHNTSLEEAIRQAKEILRYAKSLGTNKILQSRDLAQRDI